MTTSNAEGKTLYAAVQLKVLWCIGQGTAMVSDTSFIRRDHDENELIYRAAVECGRPERFSWAVRKERTSRARFGLSDKSGGPSHHNSCSKRSKKTRNRVQGWRLHGCYKKGWYWDQLNSAVCITQASESIARQILIQRRPWPLNYFFCRPPKK